MLELLASWHPFIVHFAVAFAMGSAFFDILEFLFARRRFEETGFLLMITALPFLLLAGFTGNLAESFITGIATSAVALENHFRYANIAVWSFSALAFWRLFMVFKKQYHGARKIVYIFLITAAAMSVYLAALPGGRIRHHVGKPISIESLRFSSDSSRIIRHSMPSIPGGLM